MHDRDGGRAGALSKMPSRTNDFTRRDLRMRGKEGERAGCVFVGGVAYPSVLPDALVRSFCASIDV